MKAADITGLTKPASAAPIIKRANDYIKTMADMARPVSSVTIQAAHFDAILRAVNAKLDEGDKYSGLRIGDVAVVRL